VASNVNWFWVAKEIPSIIGGFFTVVVWFEGGADVEKRNNLQEK